MTHNVDIQ